jgi:hypothetical protein
MNENQSKSPWSYCSQYSPETTVFDTYLEERKSQNSTPNTIVHRSPSDLKSEMFFTMKNLEETYQELKIIQQFQKFEFRKNLLKVINKDQLSNKSIIKQVIRTTLTGPKSETLRKKLLTVVENSYSFRFFLVFNELGQNHLPIAVYRVSSLSAVRLFGPESLPENLSETDIRFSLKFDSSTNKFKVIKSKSFNEELDAIILR